MKLVYTFLVFLLVAACKEPVKPIGDKQITIFKDTNLYFDMGFKNDSIQLNDSIIRLDAGRVLLKKVMLPIYKNQPKVTIKMTLTSNGDPWDKSGSLFVIPATADLNLLDFESENLKKEQFENGFPGIVSQEIDNQIYQPNIELLRFMTPFGVGFFNDNERVASLKPVYIPKWEENIQWEQDITQLLPVLENEVYIGVFIDTWTKEGYTISVSLEFDESEIPKHIKKEQGVISIVNTSKYAGAQQFYDAFHKGDLQVELPVEETLKNAKLYYITTGHGGHSEGDEFTEKENIISLDKKIIKQFVPWRDDCASFRRFNPTSGVWMEKATWKGEEIEERIASSDYSRSNWCPGSDVIPEIIELGDIAAGNHIFTFSIPEAQAIETDKINYWMVSAYLVYDK
ncbi:PNGase F N-terminal domain-containing protein [Bizionia myxarmorum]|uniref:N-glycanase n=1 Tax=Bizionia myxarmorum TaxID=291186 RepID=A0A5D0RCA8_9FLAO|nr:PNGase F N-terminal domain-containing protein [Bizionia myxarmorum]TYB78425.1 N-glycanase [Bizionia myxarmorum]